MLTSPDEHRPRCCWHPYGFYPPNHAKANGKKMAAAMKKAKKGIFAPKKLSDALAAICGAKTLFDTINRSGTGVITKAATHIIIGIVL